MYIKKTTTLILNYPDLVDFLSSKGVDIDILKTKGRIKSIEYSLQSEELSIIVEKTNNATNGTQEKSEEEKTLDLQIKDIDSLSSRVKSRLKGAGISTMRELAAESESDLRKLRNFGNNSLLEVKQLLEKYGLNLRSR